MKEIFINIIFAFVALGLAVYSYKKGKKGNFYTFFVITVLILAYAYKIYAGN